MGFALGLSAPVTGFWNIREEEINKGRAVLMFKGYTEALGLYYNLCIDEWTSRGYQNNMAQWPLNSLKQLMPQWLGDEQFHASHRSNLLRKDPVFYGRYGWTERPNLPYVWPVMKGAS